MLLLLDFVFNDIYSIFNSNLYLLIVFYIELRIQQLISQLIEMIEQFVIELKQQLFYLKVH